MRKVFTIGQSVFDILFENEQPFAAKVGGSMLNTSVSLGRLGVPVYFLGEFGNDFAGNITRTFLQQNKVNTQYCYQYEDGQTTISLAFLQENSNAEYNFYRNLPEKRLQLEWPEVSENDVVLFGSFYVFDEAVEQRILPFLNDARQKGAIIMYDPNFRKAHYHQIDQLKPKFMQYFKLADIVRGSDEDFLGIFGEEQFSQLCKIFPNYEALLIYTASGEGVHVSNREQQMYKKVPPIKPISTIGAGDTFNAGIIYTLLKNNVLKKDLIKAGSELLEPMMDNAIAFSGRVCMDHENYLPEAYISEKHLRL